MKYTFILFFNLISVSLFSQIKIFNNDFPAVALPYLSMDKKISNNIKVASSSDNKTKILAEVLKEIEAKPILILTWTLNDNTKDIVEPINAIHELSKSMGFKLILVNVNNDFNPSISKNPAPIDMTSEFLTKLLVEYFPSWQNIPNYYGNLYEFNSYFGTDRDLFGIFLDSSKNVIKSYSGDFLKDIEFIKAYTEHIKENQFSKDTIYYQGQLRLANKVDADSYAIKKINSKHVDLTTYRLDNNKVLSKISYKNTASNPFFPEREIVVDGKFVFFDLEGNPLLEGDSTDDFINNIRYYTNNKIVYEIKNFNTINEALKVKSNAVIANLDDVSTFNRPLQNITESATVIEYFESGKLKESYSLNSIGQVISKQQGYENGNLKFKISQNEDLRYYENGKLKSVTSYNSSGKLNGEKKSFFENGKPEVLENYENGKRNGPYISYYNNGQVEKKATYVNGEEAKGAQNFYTTGKLKFVETDTKKEYYYPNGQLFWTNYLDNSNRIEKMFYVNGTTRAIIKFDAEGDVICSSEFYNKDGNQIKKPYKLNDLIDSLTDEEAFAIYLGQENKSETDDSSISKMLKAGEDTLKGFFKENFKVKENQLGYSSLIYCD